MRILGECVRNGLPIFVPLDEGVIELARIYAQLIKKEVKAILTHDFEVVGHRDEVLEMWGPVLLKCTIEFGLCVRHLKGLDLFGSVIKVNVSPSIVAAVRHCVMSFSI